MQEGETHINSDNELPVPPDLHVDLTTPEKIEQSSSEASSDDIEAPPFSPLTLTASNTDTFSTSDINSVPDVVSSAHATLQIHTPSFKLVGDNVDKTVRPREETLETHSKSLHYFHSFAVRDRCDITGLADEPSLPDMDNINVDLVLPTAADHISLKKNMTILMTRIIHKRIKFFNENVKVERHIAHCFSKEMSQKSEVVSLELTIYDCLLYLGSFRSIVEE